MTRVRSLTTGLALGLALIAFGGVISGCGETTAEKEADATTTAQEDKATAEEEQQQARDASRQADVEKKEQERASRQEQVERKDEQQAEQQVHNEEEAASSRASGEPAPSSSSATGEEVGSASHAGDGPFCSEHRCIGSFATEDGTVVECSDGSYSHAGGRSGACSDHGGEKE